MTHAYTSTACEHELHDQCRLSCKFCHTACLCDCHETPPRDIEPYDFAVIRSEGALRAWKGKVWRWAGGTWHKVK